MDICPRHARQPPDENSGSKGREQHSYCRQHHAGENHRPDGGYFSRYSAREQNDAQRYHSDKLRNAHVAELYSKAVAAKEHANQKEYQKDGEACAVTCFAQEYTGHKQ